VARETIAGRYRLLEPLGGGAMGSVWLAEDAELGRRVAVKLLGPDADRARFEREARAAASLAHPNICQLFDYGEEKDRPFMVLEYLPGGSLDDLLERGKPLPDADTKRIANEIAEGLAHAHDRGLVHRDLKPANILFDAEGHAKIADFGIARMRGTSTLTDAGTVLGTAAYISPEQARGEVATPASDVYSAGVMLFLMLTGRLPFESPNAMALVAMHRDDQPPAVSSLRPDAPARLAATADASLAKHPAERPRDGAALLAELGSSTAAMPALPLTGERTQVIPRARPRPTQARRIVPLALLVAALLLGAGATLAVVMTGNDSGSNSSPSVTLPASTPPVSPTTTEETTAPATTEPTTTEPATTEQTTTEATTTAPPTTTARTTTAATTAPPTTTTAPTTTAPPVTTAPPPTTDTTPTTTATTTVPVP
jgi:serine/threonine protein kinase